MYTFDNTPGDWLTRSREIDQLIAESRHLRADAIANAFIWAFTLVTGKAARLAGWLFQRALQWRERQALAAELGGMTEHELSDIGLTRCDIKAVIEGRYRGERERGIRRRPLLVRLNPGIRRIPVEIVRQDKAA